MADWEDKYWKLKQEYEALQVHCNKQNEDLRLYDSNIANVYHSDTVID